MGGESMRDISIGGHWVGADHPPMVVAELSGNHNGSLERALQLIDAAAEAGVDGVKLQTYTADSITLDVATGDFLIDDPSSLWSGRTLHDLYAEAATPWEWHEVLLDRCRTHGLVGFSTPFDEAAVDALESLDVPCYKIASFEIVHLPLIRKVARTGKPIIMSTGMASISEIDEAVSVARDAGCEDIVLLKCTSSYPALPDHSNVRTIPHMSSAFGCHVGISDHTLGLGASAAAVALGAVFVEKHLTLSRSDGGVDAAFSMEPSEFGLLVDEVERIWRSLGGITYGPTDDDRGSLRFRRSVYAAADIAEGEALTARNMRIVRPGFGLHPRYFDMLIGRRVTRFVSKGTPIDWDLL